jgi:hypothetical protein
MAIGPMNCMTFSFFQYRKVLESMNDVENRFGEDEGSGGSDAWK